MCVDSCSHFTLTFSERHCSVLQIPACFYYHVVIVNIRLFTWTRRSGAERKDDGMRSGDGGWTSENPQQTEYTDKDKKKKTRLENAK